MRLIKLELNGFKSFAQKTELAFDPGITAVIGPNGSGKSNIADAIRWVLGEQSARALRGTKMEDVIFNGTQERKAQSYCDVALTFDNSDGKLPVEYSEVVVQRRVYRSGDSEFSINRNPCRLKDIHDLFRDTGIGKEGYSIIGQGKVEEILSNKSSDRRAAFEEAAGIMRYRARKEEAERKLEHTRKNLVRLNDILLELEERLGPLEQQSKDAREFIRFRDELKTLELNVFLVQYERYCERIQNQAKTIEQLLEEEELLTNTEKELQSGCREQEQQMQQIEHTISELQTQLLTSMSGTESHQGEYNVLKERLENLSRDIQRFEALKLEYRQKFQTQQKLLDELREGGSGSKRLLEELDVRIAQKESQLDQLEQDVLVQEEKLEDQKNQIMESLNRLSDAKAQLSRLEAMSSALEARLHAVADNETSFNVEKESLDQELSDALHSLEQQKAQHKTIQQKKVLLLAQQQEAFVSANELQQNLRQLQQIRDSLESRKTVLEEMSKAHEGYYASVRNVLRDAAKDYTLKKAVLGVVAELMQVSKDHETALEMALGSALQNIVTPTPEDAKLVIGHLRAHQYGRATLLPVSAIRPRVLTKEERVCLNMKGCIGVASELVGYDPYYKNVIENLLGRTVIVDCLDTGIAMNRQYHSAFRIATLQGDIIHPGGSMTGGSVQKREFSLLGREREINELQQKLADNAQKIMEAQIAQQKQQAKIDALAADVVCIEETLHQQDIEVMRQNEKLEMIQRDILQNTDQLARCRMEREQIQDNLKDIREDQCRLSSVQEHIESGNIATREDVQATQEQLNALRKQQDAMGEALTEDKVQRMALQKEADAARAERNRLERELGECEKAINQNTDLQAQSAAQKQQLEQQQSSLYAQIGIEQQQVEKLKQQQQAMEEERITFFRALSEMRSRRDEITARIREISDRRHKQELNKNRAELELTTMQERIWQDYELTYENVLPYKQQQVSVAAAHTRIDQLKTAIRELGNINVNAIEDYQAVSARYTELERQCSDLNKAELDLQTLIAELTGTMEQLFTSQFQLIQQNFSLVFTQLFGGGHAELRLSDKNDVLNCDIDIIAQPPGKKLQLLTLLSGGERALTAIALLFAMLKLKPTAFCLLDEIESSLDEVNVARFANYIKAYTSDTQFILITHRKGSMEVCNALYGVAMEEKGISKVVSARFYDTAS